MAATYLNLGLQFLNLRILLQNLTNCSLRTVVLLKTALPCTCVALSADARFERNRSGQHGCTDR